MQRRELRRCLPAIIADVAALIPKDEAVGLAQTASSLPSLVRSIAGTLEEASGTESEDRVAVLGTLSDLALMHARTAPRSDLASMPLATPTEILLWFASYLEETLEKRDLRLEGR